MYSVAPRASIPCFLQRNDLRVTHAVIDVESLANYFSFSHQNGADHRVRACERDAACRELQRAAHEDGVSGSRGKLYPKMRMRSYIPAGSTLHLQPFT